MQAIIFDKVGGPGVLKVKQVEDPKKFKKNDVLVKHTAIGVNFTDVCFRRGQYKMMQKMPAILGMEACGVVEAVASGVSEFKEGDRVAYCTGGMGAYSEKRIIDKSKLVLVPSEISDSVAAGSLLKGLAAHSFLFRAFIAKRAKRILVHSAAGGVGHFLCQWAKSLGIETIGTVSGNEKVAIASENGCTYVINRKNTDFVKEVFELTNNEGVGAVYDGIGKDTLDQSLSVLWPMGICLFYGESSGDKRNVNMGHVIKNSLFLTRPSVAMYKANRVELALGAAELFGNIKKGVLRPHITEYEFKDVAKAHKDLESGQSKGSLVLKL